MKLKFKTSKMLSRAAGRLPQILIDIVPDGVVLHNKNATAFVAGYQSWHEFERFGVHENFSARELSALDEACDPAELTRRRQYQAARLAIFCEQHGIVLGDASLDLIKAWRPTAGRPQEATETFNDQDRLLEEGALDRCKALLAELDLTWRIPQEHHIDTIVCGIRLVKGEEASLDVMDAVGRLATRLINRQVDPAARYGVRLLEALVANNFQYPVVSLAKALRNGWGTEENHPRALSLVDKALKEKKTDPKLYLEEASFIELYTLGGFLLMRGTNCKHDRARAFNLYQEAAELGDGQAALTMTQFYMPEPETGPDEYSGIVAPDPEKANYWFRLAQLRGYCDYTRKFTNPNREKILRKSIADALRIQRMTKEA